MVGICYRKVKNGGSGNILDTLELTLLELGESLELDIVNNVHVLPMERRLAGRGRRDM